MLQCGDPSGTGTGGPGYRFPNEYPTNQYRLTDPALKTPVLYPRGTLAMANAGPGTNGSQFFLVYEDSHAAADLHGVRHHRRAPAWPRWTRSPRAVSPAAATTASRRRP